MAAAAESPAAVPATAVAAAAAEVAAIEVTLEEEREEDSCVTSFDDLNRLWPPSLLTKQRCVTKLLQTHVCHQFLQYFILY